MTSSGKEGEELGLFGKEGGTHKSHLLLMKSRGLKEEIRADHILGIKQERYRIRGDEAVTRMEHVGNRPNGRNSLEQSSDDAWSFGSIHSSCVMPYQQHSDITIKGEWKTLEGAVN